MKVRARKNDSRDNMSRARIKPGRKKPVVAACLVSVMLLMWARVLLHKGPKPAAAALAAAAVAASTLASNSQVQVSYVKLPHVHGRNDVLRGDFFVSNGWAGFGSSGDNNRNVTDVNVGSKDEDSQIVRRIASRLQLRAIWSGAKRQAFINQKLLSVGDRFVVKEGVKSYDFEITEIGDNQVLIRCGDAVITLKLATPVTAKN